MEQTTQQTIQKPSLPIKTKIAAWWMIGFGILAFIFFIRLFSPTPRPEFGGGIADIVMIIIFGPALVVSGIVFLIGGALLFAKTKLGWWLSIVSLLITILIFHLIYNPFTSIETFIEEPFLFLISIIFLAPFILLLLDRKNFWKIAT